MKMKRFLTSLLAGIMLICGAAAFAGCNEKVEDFTVEEHIQRISERLEERDFTSQPPYGLTYEDFEVYPLYNENDELTYFLVEFEPCGFMFVHLRDVEKDIVSLFVKVSMYRISGLYSTEYPWSPYKAKEMGSDLEWILDENGERIYYDRSPYFISNYMSEKKYFIERNDGMGYICLVKKDDRFINVISGEEVDISNDDTIASQATINVSFIGKPQFAL